MNQRHLHLASHKSSLSITAGVVATILATTPPSTYGFVPLHVPVSITRLSQQKLRQSEILDAEFERVEDVSKKGPSESPVSTGLDDGDSKSLLDYFMETDPELTALRIPFVDGETSIDAKLGFMVELDGVNYGLGIPYDACAAITIERQDGVIENVSPDSDENTELMELMAAQLKENVGDDLQLIRSPRVLTISGPLEKYTDNWKEEILPKSYDADSLLEDEDEDVQSFLDFMKKELGEEEFTKTLNEEHMFDDEILSLFSAPGMGDSKESMEDFLRSELDDMVSTVGDESRQKDGGDLEKEISDRAKQQMEDVVGSSDYHDGVALKLVSYTMEKGGKRYSLVKLLKPVVLVAKQVEGPPVDMGSSSSAGADGEASPRFELLSNQEMKLVSPRLEEICQNDLERIGLNLEP